MEERSVDIGPMEFNEADKDRCEKLYNELSEALERFRHEGIIEVPLAVMPFAAILSIMFVMVEQQGGINADVMGLGFAKLVKHHIDAQRKVFTGTVGNA